ncbi:MAG TPA: hypothetical protein VGR72_14950 [Candidatus Acidoferrales bacterium]|nr:hypothetical protein [Candidatus Acidoferrales bacterium]
MASRAIHRTVKSWKARMLFSGLLPIPSWDPAMGKFTTAVALKGMETIIAA